MHVRFRLERTKRTALFAERKLGEYTREHMQTAVGVTVVLSQVAGEGVSPVGRLEMVLSEADAQIFQAAPLGAEFELSVKQV